MSRVGSTPFLIAVSPHLPVKTMPELIAYAKSRPGQDVLSLPEIQERLFAVGVEARTSTPAELGAFVKGEAEHWIPVIRNAGIKPE